MNFEWKFFGSLYLDFLVLGLKVMIYHDQLKLLQISSRSPLPYYCYNDYTFVKTVEEFKSASNSSSVKSNVELTIYFVISRKNNGIWLHSSENTNIHTVGQI